MTDTPTPVKCVKCSRVVSDDEPRVITIEGNTMCMKCFDELCKTTPENEWIEVHAILERRKNDH